MQRSRRSGVCLGKRIHLFTHTDTHLDTLLSVCVRDNPTHHQGFCHDVLNKLKVVAKLLGFSAGALCLLISMETKELRFILELALFQDYRKEIKKIIQTSVKRGKLETDKS